MSKLDKKIISIFLLIILLISQFSIVFAADYAGQETKKTLTQYLIENGVDENGDNVLSDAEWAKVKNLNLDGEDIDITGIEKAVNLKSLEMVGINPATIDFSKLTNLKTLYIGEVSSYNINSLNISKLNNLVHLAIDNMKQCDIVFPNDLSKLEYLNLDINNEVQLDLSNCKKLSEYSYIYTQVTEGAELFPNLTLPNHLIPSVNYYSTDRLYLGFFDRSEIKVGLGVPTFFLGEFNYSCEENDIFSIEIEDDRGTTINPKKCGSHDLKFVDVLGKEHTLIVEVFEQKEENITLDNTGVTADFIDTNTILKSNGELWKINSATTAEKIDTNVKDYVSDLVYTNDMYNGFDIENILKKDNTLVVKYNDVEKEIPNVTSMTPNMYVNTAGELYELNINYITEEMKPTKILENTERVYMRYSTKYIVMNDNTSYRVLGGWRNYTANNDYENMGQIPMTGGDGNSYWIGRYLKLICSCDHIESGCDLCQDLTESELGIAYLFERNYNEEYNRVEYIHGEEILNHVRYIDEFDSGCDILIREDGSIWTYSEQYGLTKITKSTVIEDEKVPVEEGYIVNPTIKDKEVGGKTAISGIGGNKKVEDFLNQKNFNEEYTVKVYNSQGTEVASTTIIGTGLKVKLVDSEGQVVQEYTVIVYGDTDGDGSINAFDALTLIKGINKKIAFKGEEYKEAGRIMTEGNAEPSAVDALAIVKAANNKYTINQSK